MTNSIRTNLAIALLAVSSVLLAPAASANQRFLFQSVRHVPDSEVDARVQAATQACDPTDRRAYESASFKRCMLRLGWRYTHVQRYAAPSRSQYDADLDKRNEDESNAAQQRREEQQRNDEATRDIIQQSQPQ
ncbi:MAG: hypothetical protein WDO17_14040 [Alphaproteobacteria bacterium]